MDGQPHGRTELTIAVTATADAQQKNVYNSSKNSSTRISPSITSVRN